MGVGVTLLRLSAEPFVPSIFLLPLLIATGAALYGAFMWLLLPDFLRQMWGRLALR